jgi:hypothetical protein
MNASPLPLLSSKKPRCGAPPNFDALARIYRWMELLTFGRWLERCRYAFLGDLSGCRRAAVLGDGDGRFTAQLLRVNSTVEIDAVDFSAAMLRTLVRRAGFHASRVHVHCADARTWQPANPPYDLVVMHFFLDCLTDDEVRSLADRLRGALSPSGLWVVSEFAIPEGAFGRWVARPVVWLLYRAFWLLTGLSVCNLPNHAAALSAAGFKLRKRRSWLGGLLVAEIWARFSAGLS